MILLIVYCAGSVLSLSGCAVSYQVKTQNEAKHLIDNSNGTVFLTDSLAVAANDIYVFGDSISYIDPKTHAVKALAFGDLTKIETIDRNAAALYGAAWAMGAFTGLVLYHNISGIRAVPEMEIGLAISGGVGALVGSAIGREKSLVFDPDSLETDTFVPERQGSYLAGDRQHVKKAIRIGFELGGCLTQKRGNHPNVLGYSIGASTAIKLFSFPESYFALGAEGNYTSITDFALNVARPQYGNAPGKDYLVLYRTLYDERYELSFIDVGLFPQYVFSIIGDWSASLYAGLSYGIGMERLTPYLTSQTLIDPTPRSWFWSEGPYSEYDGVRIPSVFNLGVSIYYKSLMVDIRSRQTHMVDRKKMYKNVYLQLGLSL